MPLKQEELRFAHIEGHTDVCYFEDGESVYNLIKNNYFKKKIFQSICHMWSRWRY